MAVWFQTVRHTVQTRLALLDAQLTGIATALESADAKLEGTYQELRKHAEHARAEVQGLREAGIKRGEQLDRLCGQYAWMQRVGTALLLATLVGLAGFLWDRLVRLQPSTPLRMEQKIDRLLDRLPPTGERP